MGGEGSLSKEPEEEKRCREKRAVQALSSTLATLTVMTITLMNTMLWWCALSAHAPLHAHPVESREARARTCSTGGWITDHQARNFSTATSGHL